MHGYGYRYGKFQLGGFLDCQRRRSDHARHRAVYCVERSFHHAGDDYRYLDARYEQERFDDHYGCDGWERHRSDGYVQPCLDSDRTAQYLHGNGSGHRKLQSERRLVSERRVDQPYHRPVQCCGRGKLHDHGDLAAGLRR